MWWQLSSTYILDTGIVTSVLMDLELVRHYK